MTIIALQMDNITTINVETDTTFALALEAQKRGYSLFYYQPQNLILENGILKATGHFISLVDTLSNFAQISSPTTFCLSQAACILVRQNPPFDIAYITSTYLLEFLPPEVRVLNSPTGIRSAPEKLIGLHFSALSPPTLVSRHFPAIKAFIEEHQQVILKPLFEFGGQGIIKLTQGDSNILSVLELFQKLYKEPFVIQKFLPEITEGDKRILFINGNPTGIFKRLPLSGQTRSNMVVGGIPHPCDYTARDKEICTLIGPTLKKMGLYMVGIDVIGSYLTEINVTSPTGLRVIQKLYGEDLAVLFWNELGF